MKNTHAALLFTAGATVMAAVSTILIVEEKNRAVLAERRLEREKHRADTLENKYRMAVERGEQLAGRDTSNSSEDELTSILKKRIVEVVAETDGMSRGNIKTKLSRPQRGRADDVITELLNAGVLTAHFEDGMRAEHLRINPGFKG